MSDAPSMPSGDASVATRINELLCSGLLHVKIALLCCAAVTSTEESKMPSEANAVVTRHANCNKRGFFAERHGVRVWFCVNTIQFCLRKTNDNVLGLYFK